MPASLPESTPLPESDPCELWPGLDADFHRVVLDAGRSPQGRQLRQQLEQAYLYAEGKPFLLGPPVLVRPEYAERMRELVRVYHRAIETVVAASRNSAQVRRVLSIPPELADDVQGDLDPANGAVHLCRIDLALDAQGGMWVLETNANCPGGFVFSGGVNRAWRELLEGRGVRMPAALAHEQQNFTARWYLEVAERETGVQPTRVGLLRERGGNRLELGTMAEQFRAEGVEAFELDPRELRYGADGVPTHDGQPLTHAYLKLGMQPFLAMRPELDDFVAAVRDRRLFVQNGQRGRWVGDNKLCLAVISDPAFRHLFDQDDWDLLQRHVPWSRNIAMLRTPELEKVRWQRERYVLKRNLDTRGNGVIVGREVADGLQWHQAVERAVAEGWLVQEYHQTTRIERDFDQPGRNNHDLALGAINGELTALFMRSSSELRVNMARTGRMHPVFLGDETA